MMAGAELGSGSRPRNGVGCLGSVVALLVLVAIVAAVIFVGVIVLAIFAALVVIGLLVLLVDRVALALSPKRRERRAEQRRTFFWQSGQVIDTTATLDEPKSEE